MMFGFLFRRREPACQDGTGGFDFSKVGDVDDATVAAFFEATTSNGRQMPLLIARFVYGQLEERMTGPTKIDAMQLAEIRGGMRALRAFGVFYTNGIEAWKNRHRKGAEDDS